MVFVYAADISELPDPLLQPDVMQGISSSRKEKILSFRQVNDRKRCLGAGILLNQILSIYGKDTENIYYNKNGKPQIDGIFFNLSHAHHMVICAVSSMEVGCDIEWVESGMEHIAKNYFSHRECTYLQETCEELRLHEFFRLCTMKESYVKMTGEGMSLGLDTFEVDFSDKPEIYRKGVRCSCFLREYDIPGYKMTVCAQESEFDDLVTVEI